MPALGRNVYLSAAPSGGSYPFAYRFLGFSVTVKARRIYTVAAELIVTSIAVPRSSPPNNTFEISKFPIFFFCITVYLLNRHARKQ